MILYLSIMLFGTLLISGLNIIFGTFAFANNIEIWVLSAVSLGVVIEFCIDGIFATLIHALPDKWFTMDKKIYNVSKKERKFYDKVNIKSWKDKIWELGALGGFRKNKINDPNSPKYIEQFIIESNKGVIIHIAGVVMGFLILLFPMPKYWFSIGLPIAIINAFLNILPIMALRYNIPRLLIAYQRSVKTLKKVEKDKNIVNNEDNQIENIKE